MMAGVAVPEVNMLIELAVFGGETYASRVEDRDGERVTVAAPLNLLIADLPEIGRRVTLRWSAGARGRYAAPATIVDFKNGQVATWDVTITGPAEIEQHRQYVRGGGGEPLRLHSQVDPKVPAVDARVVDISERSVRGRFKNVTFRAGDTVMVRMVLDDDVIETEGSVLRVVEQPEPHVVDVVVLYEVGEPQAAAIRRYVLRQQMLARARASK